MMLKLSSLLSLALAAAVTPANADTLILQGGSSAVTHIRSDQPGNNYGTDPQLIIGKTTAPAFLNGLLSFDLSGIPAGSTITSITLTLTASGTGSTTNQSGSVALNLYDLAGSFTEGGGLSSGTASNTTATWSSRGPDETWATPGGDFTTLLTSANVDPATNWAGTASLFSSTSAFVDAAQSAFDNAEPLTMLLKLNATNEAENLRRAFFFVSDEPTGSGVSLAENSPKLTIEYVPEPTSAALLIGGTITLLARRRRPSLKVKN